MPEPKYQQIASDLERKIRDGELPVDPADPRLPTEYDLQSEYNASRNTVREAIKLLITRRVVETRPGHGTYVVEPINPFVTTLTDDPKTSLGGGEGSVYIAEAKASGRDATSSDPVVKTLLAGEIELAPGYAPRHLGVDPGSEVVSRHQERFIDGRPWSLQTSFYPMKLVKRGAVRLRSKEDIGEGTVTYLAHALGIKQRSYQDSIEVRAANAGEVSFFNLPPDGRIQVFEICRVSFDESGERFRLTVTVYPTDRNRFLINVGNVPPSARRPPA